MARLPLVACHHCARLHSRHAIPARGLAACTRCGYVLYRESGVPLNGWIAISITALVVFAIANYFPIAHLQIQGKTVDPTLLQALLITWQQGHIFVAIVSGLFAFLVPLAQIFYLLWAFTCLARRKLAADFRYGMRVLHALEPWSMVPVLLLAIFVSTVKLAGMARFEPGPGIWGYAALTVLLTVLSRVSAHRLWRHAEDLGLVPVSGQGVDPEKTIADCLSCGHVQNMPEDVRDEGPEPFFSGPWQCERCGASVHERKPASESRSWAFIAAAALLYIPSNVLPVMHIRTAVSDGSYTILGGVRDLWNANSEGLAIIVFVASVVVPLTKLLALSILLLRRRWRGRTVQRQRTRLYELVEFIGQWSMLDVFVVVLLASMAAFPGFSEIRAGAGAAPFGMVVILTMLAAMSYDPRRGWDADPSSNTLPLDSQTDEKGDPSVPGGPEARGTV